MGPRGDGGLRGEEEGARASVTDTQWPRYFVFKQDAEDEPHLNCGTIHAPDSEMALLNARDVFVRRPECVSLWVVPDFEVLARTREELERNPPQGDPVEEREGETFAIFLKRDHRRQHSFAGEFVARSRYEALSRAWDEYADTGALGIWVVPQRAVTRSESIDRDAWFGPARDKPYRHGSFYRTNSLMREIMAGHASKVEEQGEG